MGRAVAGPTRGVSRPSVRSRPSRRRRARPTTIRARVERHAATQAHGGRLGLPLQGLTLPHGSGRFPQAVTRPGPPRSASRRSGRQAQGRRPALNHHRLIRALLFLACTAELTGGAPANAMAPGTPQESGACPRVCEAAEETAALRRAACPNSVFTGNAMSDGECGCRPVSLLGTETAWHIAARLHGAAPIRETRRRRGS